MDQVRPQHVRGMVVFVGLVDSALFLEPFLTLMDPRGASLLTVFSEPRLGLVLVLLIVWAVVEATCEAESAGKSVEVF